MTTKAVSSQRYGANETGLLSADHDSNFLSAGGKFQLAVTDIAPRAQQRSVPLGAPATHHAAMSVISASSFGDAARANSVNPLTALHAR